MEATQKEPYPVTTSLDSRYGRDLADGVNSHMHYGASVTDAVAKTSAEWMGWRITQRTSRETGIRPQSDGILAMPDVIKAWNLKKPIR